MNLNDIKTDLNDINLISNFLMKFDIQKDFMSQSSYFKSRPDLLTSGGVGGGNLANIWSGGIGMKLGGQNKKMSLIRD